MPKSMSVEDVIRQEADKAGIPAALALAVAEQESSFNPTAVNKQSGAMGTFQILPSTAKTLGIDANDPMQNIHGGVTYLRQLMDRHDGNVDAVLKEYGGVKTDTAYVPGVMGRLKKFKDAPAAQPQPATGDSLAAHMGPRPIGGYSITDEPEKEHKPGLMERLNTMLAPSAHPTSASDMAGLLIPDANLGGAVRIAGQTTKGAPEAVLSAAENHPGATSAMGAGLGYYLHGPMGAVEGALGGGMMPKALRILSKMAGRGKAIEGEIVEPAKAAASVSKPIDAVVMGRNLGRELPPGPRMGQPAPDPSFARGVPAEPAMSSRQALPPSSLRTGPTGADPSFARGVPASPAMSERPALPPAPKTTILPEPTNPLPNDPSRVVTSRATRVQPTRDPKTGRMRRTFSSESEGTVPDTPPTDTTPVSDARPGAVTPKPKAQPESAPKPKAGVRTVQGEVVSEATPKADSSLPPLSDKLRGDIRKMDAEGVMGSKQIAEKVLKNHPDYKHLSENERANMVREVTGKRAGGLPEAGQRAVDAK